ncbi:hypothetical protein PGTUg99_009774 [Puccinia graminis f. sp. tritici]|uniref:Uncharacterized protein n=1 Tax=Puccinia graminis f. sp. tritici TaxID=56615 RepID=A0A5B0RZZ0_PUCGR|nr:hypothetical protein PGTUg99_009774 [Puccinia graminis f. sp. tritici]
MSVAAVMRPEMGNRYPSTIVFVRDQTSNPRLQERRQRIVWRNSDKAEGSRPGTTSGGGRAVSVRVRVQPVV